MEEIDYRDAAPWPAAPDGTGLSEIIPRFPDRAFDVGIAESHAVDMCAGMAKVGMKPFVTVYSTFLQRGFDQVFPLSSLHEINVVLTVSPVTPGSSSL